MNSINAMSKMQRFYPFVCSLLLICIVQGVVHGNGGSDHGLFGFESVELEDADFDEQKDAEGYTWDIEGGGRIDDGTNYLFSYGFELGINGNEVDFSDSRMTSGGGEFVFTGSEGNFDVIRRVKVLRGRSAIRYIETVKNTTDEEKECEIEIRTDFRSDPSRVITPSNKSADGTLAAGERGIAAVLQSGNRPSLLFVIGGERNNVLPSVSSDDERVHVTYTLDVPPQSYASVVHLGAQRRKLKKAEQIKQEMAPFFKYSQLNIDVPREVASSIKNMDVRGASIGVPAYQSLFTPLQKMMSKRGIQPSDRAQVILRDGSRLTGDVSWKSLKVKTTYGMAKLTSDQVVAFLGSAGGKQSSKVYLRNGEIYSGKIVTDGLKIKSKSGLNVALAPDEVDVCVLRATDLGSSELEGAQLMVHGYSGNRIRLNLDDEFRFRVTTPWGSASFDPDKIRVLRFRSEPRPLFHLYLNNGTHVPVFLRNKTMKGVHPNFGKIQFSSQEIAELSNVRFFRNVNNDSVSGAEKHPHLLLDGNYVLVGTFQFDGLSFTSVSKSLTVVKDRIRQMERIEGAKRHGEPPKFLMKLTGGDELRGTAGKRVLSVNLGGQSLTIPANNIQMYRKPKGTGDSGNEKNDEGEN